MTSESILFRVFMERTLHNYLYIKVNIAEHFNLGQVLNMHFILILRISLWFQYYYYPHLTLGQTEMLTNMPKVIELVNGNVKI